MHDLLLLLERHWPHVVALAMGAFAVYRQWRSERDAKAARAEKDASQRVDLIKIAQEVADDAIRTLRSRVEELERELGALQKRHTTMTADKDAKITLLEGEKRQLQAQIDAYRDLLIRNNIPLPKQSQAYWLAEDGELKPMEASTNG